MFDIADPLSLCRRQRAERGRMAESCRLLREPQEAATAQRLFEQPDTLVSPAAIAVKKDVTDKTT